MHFNSFLLRDCFDLCCVGGIFHHRSRRHALSLPQRCTCFASLEHQSKKIRGCCYETQTMMTWITEHLTWRKGQRMNSITQFYVKSAAIKSYWRDNKRRAQWGGRIVFDGSPTQPDGSNLENQILHAPGQPRDLGSNTTMTRHMVGDTYSTVSLLQPPAQMRTPKPNTLK
jgi:hypothetical protein